MMRPLYSLAGLALTPLIHLWLLRRAGRGKEDHARLRERFGHASVPRPEGKLIWLHAASVGEAQSVLTLLRALLERYPAMHLLVTSGTVTSAALIQRAGLPRVIHHYVPVDTHCAVRRFLNHWHPDLALWVESELWPQMLWQLKAGGTPALLINARLSARSFERWRRWPHTIRSLLSCFTTVYAGSTADADRLRQLGAVDLRDIGNLKYDAQALPVDTIALDDLTRMCAGRRVWVAASTHANEEQMIAQVHALLRSNFPDLLTVIVPRHATRGDAIAADLRTRGFTLAQRSKGERVQADTAIYLADTMGELGTFYRLSELVFLGGSLVAHGGHNPLEPARLQCTLLTGPHTHNFESIIHHLLLEDAIRIVATPEMLADALHELWKNDTNRLSMAERAALIVDQAKGAGAQILQDIHRVMEPA